MLNESISGNGVGTLAGTQEPWTAEAVAALQQVVLMAASWCGGALRASQNFSLAKSAPPLPVAPKAAMPPSSSSSQSSPSSAVPPTGDNNAPGAGEAAILAPPMRGKRLDISAPSVRDVKQASAICAATEANNRQRAYRASVVQQVYDGAAPNSFSAKLAQGKAWQNNFSTNWLAGIVQPLHMRLQNAVVTSETLTYSTMPDTIENYEQKTELLQQAQSNVLRNWDDFSDYLSAVAVDTSLQGYCFGVFLDPITPFPTFFKLEDCRVPEKSKMNPARLQYLCADWDYPVQDFIELFRDEEAAQANGYNIKECEAAANRASVEAEGTSGATTNKPRRFAEMVNEGGVGYGYNGGGARVVKTWLFWNVEYDGKVTFWLIDRQSKTELRRAERIYDSMADVVQLFSFEGGNSCIHSSKGVGRVLINQALALEKNRNRMLDNMGLESMMVLQAGAAARQKLDVSVNAPFVLIDDSAKISPEKFAVSSDGYIGIDRFLTSAAQQAAGVWINDIINPANNKSDKTATEARIENSRGQESAAMFISRFLDKWHGMVATSQRRAWADDNLDAALDVYGRILENPRAERASLYAGHACCEPNVLREIVAVLKKWPGGVDPRDAEGTANWKAEIAVWRESPATLRAHILDEKFDAGVQQLYGEQAQAKNPGIDQAKLLAKRTRALVGHQYAAELVIPSPDETLVAEATRAQLGENADMMVLAQPVPVSPRDNWKVHGRVCVQALQQMTADLPPEKAGYAQLILGHLGAHLDVAMAAGESGNEDYRQLYEFAQAYQKQFQQVQEIRAHAAAAQAAVVQHLREQGHGEPAAALAAQAQAAFANVPDANGNFPVPPENLATVTPAGSIAGPVSPLLSPEAEASMSAPQPGVEGAMR